MSIELTMRAVMERTQYLPEADVTVRTEELTEDDREEVLGFLSERPIHTICMMGLIRDNGLVSPHNRGIFYSCRNSAGRLEGVALVGHATLVEARTRRASEQFALAAQCYPQAHMILGELERVEEFWNYYADEGQEMRLACRELLFELRKPAAVLGEAGGLRLATREDLELIAPVQAHLAEMESGVDPLETDPEGFRARCLRRIERRRTWVLVEGAQLVFKAEIQADTPDMVYLEGVYVAPAYRGDGIGRRCLTQLCRRLLARTKAVCLLANEENLLAQAFYRMCGFKLRGVYDTIFLRQG